MNNLFPLKPLIFIISPTYKIDINQMIEISLGNQDFVNFPKMVALFCPLQVIVT